MQRLERLEQLQMERENQAKQPRATVQAEPAAQRVEARSNAALAESVVTAELGSEGADSSFVNMRLQPAKFTWASALQRHSERGEHVPEKCSRKAMRGAGPAKHEPNNTLSTSAWDMSRLARESSDFEDCGLSLACFPNMPQRPSLRLCLFLRQTLVFCLPACLPACLCLLPDSASSPCNPSCRCHSTTAQTHTRTNKRVRTRMRISSLARHHVHSVYPCDNPFQHVLCGNS